MDTKKPIAQYAGILDTVAYAPTPSNAFKINGILDILSVDKNKFLVIKRSYSTGRLARTIKVFIADVSSAENVQELSSLKNKPELKAVSKKLLLNMDKLGIYINNVEGATFGPTLPNGKRSFLFVADNNLILLNKHKFCYLKLNKIFLISGQNLSIYSHSNFIKIPIRGILPGKKFLPAKTERGLP